MRTNQFILLSSLLAILLLPHSLHAADFNIKLRKTDINELKQQIMPTFEHNIRLLNGILNCLEQGKQVDWCIDQHTVTIDDKSNTVNTQRNEQLKQSIKKKINDKDIQQEQIILELKKLLSGAEKVKQCLYQGQTANDLKDCVIQYNQS